MTTAVSGTPEARRWEQGRGPEAVEEAIRRIEGWLLAPQIQVSGGPHRGGIAGRLDARGRPEFVYLEITGYYLTALAWLTVSGTDPISATGVVRERGRAAVDWMRRVTEGGRVPPTRVYLEPGAADWRNGAVFSFDLAMAARGLATYAAVDPAVEAGDVVRDLTARVGEVCGDGIPLASHWPLPDGGPLPDKWSTRPGPHGAKMAAALALLPPGTLEPGLAAQCAGTLAHWASAMLESWPCEELHALLYGVEGLMMRGTGDGDAALEVVEPLIARALGLQGPDGSLPALVGERPGGVRADVLAQALRIGAILRAHRRLAGDAWGARLDALAAALVAHVRPDGGVLFSQEHPVPNTWCAMFAHQALVLHARAGDAALAGRATALLV